MDELKRKIGHETLFTHTIELFKILATERKCNPSIKRQPSKLPTVSLNALKIQPTSLHSVQE